MKAPFMCTSPKCAVDYLCATCREPVNGRQPHLVHDNLIYCSLTCVVLQTLTE